MLSVLFISEWSDASRSKLLLLPSANRTHPAEPSSRPPRVVTVPCLLHTVTLFLQNYANSGPIRTLANQLSFCICLFRECVGSLPVVSFS